MKDFREELSKLPEEPGIYLMKDKDDNIIYVGKAINLRNRVRSYFQSKNNLQAKVKAMVDHVDHFDYVVVKNEIEALVMESNFIKEHDPHYNILLRDDKQYPFIKVTNEKYPRILKVRRIEDDGGKYFGPYPNSNRASQVIELLRQKFLIRNCNLNLDNGPVLKRPCIYYSIGRCDGPCAGLGDYEKYMEGVKSAIDFLEGKTDELLDMLRKDMKEASLNLDFENAAKYRDYIEAVNYLNESQKITRSDDSDIDFIASRRNEVRSAIEIFYMRDGKILDQDYFIIDNEYNEPEDEVMAQFLKQYYVGRDYVPREIYLDVIPNDLHAINSFLEEKKGKRVYIKVPYRGEKRSQIELVKRNAREMLDKHERKVERKERKKNLGLKELEEVLNLEDLYRIEAYDISNIFGDSNVGSMIVFENGIKANKEYRKFKIKTISHSDDYGSHREMLERRFNRYVKEKEAGKNKTGFGRKPDLIMMDGGKGQVNVCLEVLKEFGLNDEIEVIGLVKDDKHTTRGIIYNNKEIPLKVNSPLYRFLYKIQEEMHRFALNYHKTLRKREMRHSILDDIPNIGEKRKRNLLRKFKSVNKIRNASIEELVEVEGISETIANNIKEFFERGTNE